MFRMSHVAILHLAIQLYYMILLDRSVHIESQGIWNGAVFVIGLYGV